MARSGEGAVPCWDETTTGPASGGVPPDVEQPASHRTGVPPRVSRGRRPR